MKKRVLSLLLVLLLVVSLLPVGTFAADTGKVRVIVENTTLRQKEFTVNDQTFQVPWYDQLFDVEVDYESGMTMDGALRAGVSSYLNHAADVSTVLQYEKSDWGAYLIGIKGLLNWGTNGWMASLNDWFDMNNGMDAVEVAPGDAVRVMYTQSWGSDLGAVYGSTDKGLKNLSFDYGVLYPAFSHDVTEYTLYVPHDVTNVLVSPTAACKYNKVFVAADGEKDVRWGARSVPVSAGKATVTVDGGTAYTVNFVPMAAPAPTPAPKPCDGGADCPSKDFQDVDRGAKSWYHEAVDWAVTNDVTKGVSATAFGPGASCTRAQMVTFLWRAVNSPEPKTEKTPFVDVAKDAYYCKAVLWAAENEITAGVDATHFAPGAAVSRAQTVTFLWRLENKAEPKDTKSFPDVPADAYYAKAVAWAVENEITAGVDATHFAPGNDCTRAQIVTFLWRDQVPAEQRAAVALAENSSPLDAASAFMQSAVTAPKCGESDWAVFDLERNAAKTGSKLPDGYGWYYETVEAKAKETSGKMDANYSTDYSRIVLTVTALGYNAADVAGFDLTEKLSDVKYVTGQGVNGAIYALLALDSGDYVSYARPDYVQAVLDAQLKDGGFTYMADTPTDPDLTAMAIQALAPYLDQEDVAAAMRKAVACLSDLQQKDGGFFSWGASSCESTAQAIIAVETLRAQPGDHDDFRDSKALSDLFQKADGNLHDNLLTFQLKDGSFCHVKDDLTTNGYANEQALRALVAEQCASLGVTLYDVR